MPPFRFRSVATRQIWLAALSCLVLCVSAVVGMGVTHELTQHSRKSQVAKDVVADILPPPVYLIEARLVVSQVLEGTMAPADAQRELERLAGAYDERVRHWTAEPPFGLERNLLGQQHDHAQTFLAKARELVAARAAGRESDARALLDAAHGDYRLHRVGVDETVAAGAALAASAIRDFDRAASRSQAVLGVVLGLGVLAMLGLSWMLSQSLIVQLRRARDVAQAVAQGDLQQRVEVGGRDEVADLLQALNHMCQALGRIVGDVRSLGQSLATASEQVATGSAELRERADKHQSELKSTSLALKAVTGFVTQNAQAAEEASRLAQETGRTAHAGVSAVEKVGDTMQGITRSSDRVGDMVSLIDGIAFQTNLLALNAAVEAARAGEQGKGFAVVASEVRLLANRASDAAREIKQLVDTSRGEVAAGGPLTQGARASIHEMVGQVNGMSTLVQGIWETTFAQSSGINMLDESVELLARDAASHLEMVSQTSDLALDLAEHAGALTRTVRTFRLPEAAPS